MARIRNISPKFFEDETISRLPFGARLLYIGLWTRCDLRGVFELNIKLISAALFPYDEAVSTDQVGKWIELLIVEGRVVSFEASGKRWGIVPRFSDHQVIGKSERDYDAKSKVRFPVPQTVIGIETDLVTEEGTDTIPETVPKTVIVTIAETVPETTGHRTEDIGRRTEDVRTASARDEHDITAQPVSQKIDDAQRWGYVRAEPWAKALVAAGCKIGPQNWPAWHALVAAHGHERVAEVAKTCPATDRWPDRTETALLKSGGQAPLAQTIKHRIRSIE